MHPGQRPLVGEDQAARIKAEIDKSLEPTAQRCIELGDAHGPENWRETIPPDRLAHIIREGERIPVIVLAADVRRSTALMKEATVPREYAKIVSMWITTTRTLLRGDGVWFDKFTGDGFLAYWLVPDGPETPLKDVINIATRLIGIFDLTLAWFREPRERSSWRRSVDRSRFRDGGSYRNRRRSDRDRRPRRRCRPNGAPRSCRRDVRERAGRAFVGA